MLRAIRKLPDGLALQLVAQAAPSPSYAEQWFQQLVGALHMRVHRKREFSCIYFYIQIKLTHGIFHPWELK